MGNITPLEAIAGMRSVVIEASALLELLRARKGQRKHARRLFDSMGRNIRLCETAALIPLYGPWLDDLAQLIADLGGVREGAREFL